MSSSPVAKNFWSWLRSKVLLAFRIKLRTPFEVHTQYLKPLIPTLKSLDLYFMFLFIANENASYQ